MLSIDLENQSSSPDPSPCSSFHFLPSSIPNSISPSIAPSSEVDLPNSLPNFSIRDYVLASRRKDIEKNWPFSLKSLQLCLKHGVKDVLPPFQNLQTLRYQSLGLCKDENKSTEKYLSNNLEDPSLPALGHAGSDLENVECSKKKLAEPCVDLSSSRYGDENDLPSTTTSVSLSEIESTVLDKIQSRSGHHKCSTVSQSLTEVKAADPGLISKAQGSSRRLGRKCNLIVKFAGQSGRNSTEDISSNCSSVLDSMASKVCPVCKAFSSSSNTTLNAHIDQCLSAQSTPTWTADSKLSRNRIKPRKSRLMTDVYATAARCTLEDLDSRNGTNWAANSFLANKETEETRTAVEERSPNKTGGDVGPVYIDANGTKVRILSKLNVSLPLATVAGSETRRKTAKGSRFAKKKIKMYGQQKSLKFQHSKKRLHHKAAVSQIRCTQKIQKDSNDAQQSSMVVQNDDSATVKQWIRSKRRGMLKKTRYQGPGKSVRCKWHLPQELLFKSDQLFHEISLKNRADMVRNDNMSSMLHRATYNQMEGKAPDNFALESSHSSSGNVQPVSNESVGIQKKAIDPPEKLLESSDAIIAKAKNFLSFRKSILSEDNGSFTAECRRKVNKSAVCKSHQHSIASGDEQVTSHFSRRTDMEPHCERECDVPVASLGKRKFQQNSDEKTTHSTNQAERIFGVRSSKSVGCHGVKGKSNMIPTDMESRSDCSGRSGGDANVCEERTLFRPCPKDIFVRTESSYVEYVDSEYYVSGHSPKVQSSALHSFGTGKVVASENERPNLSVVRGFHPDNLSYGCEESANGISDTNTRFPVHMGCGAFPENSFTVVDPIPIPGPPGSYLPSPRDMGSEDFQGHSSLTTSRVQSSVDLPDAVDGDSSDSPISVASTISNSVGVRSETGVTVNPSMVNSKEPCSAAEKIDLSMQKGNVSTNFCPERNAYAGEFVKVAKSTENGFVNYRSDQPCCCQRQDSFTPYEDSQSSRGRRTCPLTLSPYKQHMDSYSGGGNSISESVSAATPGQEALLVPGMNMVTGSSALNDCPSSGRRGATSIECDSGSSGANPVLRLMGKNLMVVTKYDESPTPPPERNSNCSPQNLHLRRQLSTLNPVSPAYSPHNIHYSMSRNPGSCDNQGIEDNYFEGRSFKSSGMMYNQELPYEAAQFPGGLHRGVHRDYAFETSLDNYKSNSSFSSLHNRTKNWQNTSSAAEKEVKHYEANIPKEIIFVDQECDFVGVYNAVQANKGWREADGVHSVSSMPAALNYNPSRVYPISCYPPTKHPVHGESVSFHHPTTAMTPMRLPEPAALKWGCTSYGSSVMSEMKHVPSSSSSSSSYYHVKSPAFYYNSGFA